MLIGTICLFGLAMCWFAIEGLRRRVNRLEEMVASRFNFPKPDLTPPAGIDDVPLPPSSPFVPDHDVATPVVNRPAADAPSAKAVGDRLRWMIFDSEWEVVIGGSWL